MNDDGHINTNDGGIPYHYHLHYITVIKGIVWFLFLILMALYLPNIIWSDQIFSLTLSLDFLFRLLKTIIFEQDFKQLPYFTIAIWAICWFTILCAPMGLVIYILRFFDTAIEINGTILTYKKGLFFISEREIDIRDIEEIFVNSGVMGAALNYGYITFVIEGDRFIIPNIKNPKDLVNRLNHLKSLHQK